MPLGSDGPVDHEEVVADELQAVAEALAVMAHSPAFLVERILVETIGYSLMRVLVEVEHVGGVAVVTPKW